MEPFVIEQDQKSLKAPIYRVKEVRDWTAFLKWFTSDVLGNECAIGMMGQLMHFKAPEERFWWAAGFQAASVHAGGAPLPPYGVEGAVQVLQHGMLEGRVELTTGPAFLIIGHEQEIITGRLERRPKLGARILVIQDGKVVAEQWRGKNIETLWDRESGLVQNVKALEAAIVATLARAGRRW